MQNVFFFWNEKQSKICNTKINILATYNWLWHLSVLWHCSPYESNSPARISSLFWERKLVTIECCSVPPQSPWWVGLWSPSTFLWCDAWWNRWLRSKVKIPQRPIAKESECGVWAVLWVMQSYQAVIWVLIGSRAASRCLQLQPSLLHYNYTIHSLATAQLQTTTESLLLWIETKLSANPSPACSLGDESRNTRACKENLREDFTIKVNRGGPN